MTGMKEGAGENPFAEETSSGTSDREDETDLGDVESAEDNTEGPVEQSASSPEQSTNRKPMQIPYKFRRDGVQDGRDRVPLFLHSETKRDERDALRELEERLDDDVSLTDLREALVIAGLDHLDEVEGQLEEWGYGMVFDN
ncbi:hypothetical protein [Natrarchaeobaculum sulfurireducens]|uniref:Uncharacterized protein n=1 Tax=Natrarchaeobaculum sulfurireducens TaxID=2044521 RepID=A0A346P9L6_9EURY|nr:hypothetical protein [Natrarchaeobaculum sulfurireducens]AXR76211.1 hypothetical protein AArc1_5010 [Natrarchaeobaculum sulfurireducens]AXR79882.1 hypothetical protein AArcMg_4057 [Natrarchaeobaculum sulfurireducens]